MCPTVVEHSTEAFAAVSYLQFSVELVDKGLPSGLSQLQLLCSGQSPFQYPVFLTKKVFKSSKSTENSVDTTTLIFKNSKNTCDVRTAVH